MARLRNPHPGETLQETMEERGLTAYRLSRETGIPESALSGILKGKRSITARTAIRLAEYFGTSAEFWLNYQMLYDLEEERRKREPAAV